MPQIIVNQDMASYVKYAKAKSREELQKSLAIILFGSGLVGFVVWVLWDMVHV